MHVVELLHKFFKKSGTRIHAKRLNVLFIAVKTLTLGKKLTVTGLGRSFNTPAKVKNRIKQVDRLIGNKALHAVRKKIYSISAQLLMKGNKKPFIIIDWSALPHRNFCLLRAAIATQGRTLSIYEEVHPLKQLNNHKVYTLFLKTLHEIIPEGSKPIIIVDAGFYGDFYREIEKLGWDWVGRIRNQTKYKTISSKDWIACKKLHKKANRTPQFIGEVILGKKAPIQCALYLYQDTPKGRIAKNKSGKRKKSIVSIRCAKSNKEPWVLATSLKGDKEIGNVVKNLYKKRMQIEESFRDIKNTRWGFSLNESLSYKPERFEMLLLIAMLAILAVSILGKAGERHQLQYAFQANTIRNRTVLSLFFLGCQMMKEIHLQFTEMELWLAFDALAAGTNQQEWFKI